MPHYEYGIEVIMMTKANRALTLLLAGLLMLGGAVSLPGQSLGESALGRSGETDEQISALNYTPLEIESIFNMTKEEALKKISLISTAIFPISFKGLPFYLPFNGATKKILKEGTKESINEKEEILLSDLKKYVNDPFFEKLLDSSNGFVEEYQELSTGNVIGYIFYNSNKFFLNHDFFINIVTKDNFDEITISNSSAFMDFIKKEYMNEYEMLSKKFITLEECFEFYKKAIPSCYWPVIYELPEKNVNNSIPKLKDEILNESFASPYFSLYVAIEKTNKNIKLFLSKFNEDNDNTYDVITDEIIQYDNGKFNNEYFKNIGINSMDNLYYFGYNSFGMSNKILEENPILKPLAVYFVDCEMVRDVLDIYQYLPSEMQVDYSYFDFSGSPNADPAWLADQPAFAPPLTRTPLPYAELNIGSKGQEVLDLKQRFLELGYFRTTSFNDRFTDSTADTVRRFEKNNGLPVDGVADAVMLGVLFSDKAVPMR